MASALPRSNGPGATARCGWLPRTLRVATPGRLPPIGYETACVPRLFFRLDRRGWRSGASWRRSSLLRRAQSHSRPARFRQSNGNRLLGGARPMLSRADVLHLLADELTAWVDGDFPSLLSCSALSRVCFSGMTFSFRVLRRRTRCCASTRSCKKLNPFIRFDQFARLLGALATAWTRISSSRARWYSSSLRASTERSFARRLFTSFLSPGPGVPCANELWYFRARG
jgi:hypothetical protein